MFVKVTYAQTIEAVEVSNPNNPEEEELDEVFITNDPEEEKENEDFFDFLNTNNPKEDDTDFYNEFNREDAIMNEVVIVNTPIEPEEEFYYDFYSVGSFYRINDVFTTNDPEEEELDDCHPDSDNYDECYCYPENCEDPQTQENCNKTCPDSQTLNTVSCTCVNKPNKNWYQDLDGDGYHSATKSFYKSRSIWKHSEK